MSDRLRRQYERKKASLVSSIGAVVAELKKADTTPATLIPKVETMKFRREDFMEINQHMMDALDDDDDPANTAELYTLEDERSEKYGDTVAIIIQVEEFIRANVTTTPVVPQTQPLDVSFTKDTENLHRLPKLELPKFGGDPKEWLQFKTGFATIDEDGKLAESIKLQYLLSCMKKGSEAEKMVSRFQGKEGSYSKAYKALEERYGREDMLVEIYVRDLLSLTMDNVHNKNNDVPSLYHNLSVQLSALETLGVTSDKCAVILYPMVESALPRSVLEQWERYRQQNTTAADKSDTLLNKLLEFLKCEVEGLERIRLARQPFTSIGSTAKEKSTGKPLATAATLYNQAKAGCAFCGGNHSSHKCFKATKMSLEEKKKHLYEKRRCFKCFKPDHISKKCTSEVKCSHCGDSHADLLCPGTENVNAPVEVVRTNMNTARGTAIFQTILVKLIGTKKSKVVRAFFDSGSSCSYVLKSTAQNLGLNKVGSKDVIHQLFGGVKSHPQRHTCYHGRIESLDSSFSCNMELQDSVNICEDIPCVPRGRWMEELTHYGITLTETSCNPTEIEILFGTDVFGKLLTGERRTLSCGPTAINTVFGWTIGGKLTDIREADSTEIVYDFHIRDVSIQDLWSLDVIGINDPMKDKTREELTDAAMVHFNKTVTRREDGRYVVQLPWVDGHPPIPSYKFLAEKKLASTTSMLKKNGVIVAYHEVFCSWERENIVERISGGTGHYLSHHGVLKPDSETTPVRPVFNASFKTKGHPSLNECLEIGPNLLEEVPTIITRSRLGAFAVTADIKKAFLQIEVAEQDRDFLRFLWHKDDKLNETQEFRHCRVVFGVSSSPFLLNATIQHHLDSYDQTLELVKTLKKSFYVDNLVSSMSSLEEAEIFKQESIRIFEEAKMDLRCWEIGPSVEEKIVPMLGLSWNTKDDSFSLDMRKVIRRLDDGPVTRRKMLSMCHSVFDPLGFSCPITIVPKILLQKTCKLKADWDSPVQDDIAKEFTSWCTELDKMKTISVPRRVVSCVNRNSWSLHVFCDASAAAFAACAYLRSGSAGNVTVRLVCARVRVSPMKDTTIPRLELVGALCAARLADKVKKMLEFQDISTSFYCDSTCTIAWIQREENWSVFVGNRVREILTLSDKYQWFHVPGIYNPADIPSRGATVEKLKQLAWWEGPEWLKLESNDWPVSRVYSIDEDLINGEKRKTVLTHVNSHRSDDILSGIKWHFSYHGVLRVIAYVLRFIKNARTKSEQRKKMSKKVVIPGICFDELKQAEEVVVRLIQTFHFENEKDKRFESICVIRDDKGLLRVKTRSFCGDESGQNTYPLVLPSKDPIVKKMIWSTHLLSCHAGTQMMLGILLEKFWIIHARRSIWSVIRSCVKCRRFKSRAISVPAGPLPKERTTLGKAFGTTGVDLAGPLFTKGNRKVWIVLYTCTVYRAIHLELCGSLSTEAFIQTFRRFVARRGRPETMMSDNGTNFVGCNNYLKSLDWDQIVAVANVQQIKWKFNPPTCSWWGGIWERMIGIVKQLLRSVLGSARVNNDELWTLLCDVEAVINNRPLTYVHENDELVPLTPQHFINNCGEVVLPDLDQIEREHLVLRYKNLQSCRDEMQNRFRKEYLAFLVHHGKQKKSRQIKIGEVVLIGNDRQKRLDWPMGIVEELLPGKDGVVRVVRLKTSHGTMLRAVQRLYPLEIN